MPFSSRLTKHHDGSVLAEFLLDDTEEIKHWILSFGQQAMVVEPEGLRQEILAELETLTAAYRQLPTVLQK